MCTYFKTQITGIWQYRKSARKVWRYQRGGSRTSKQTDNIMAKGPASTLRIHNVAVWLLFGQVPFLRENYVATTYFRYASRCDNVFSNVFVTYGYGLDANVKTQT